MFGNSKKPFFVAEISSNHNGILENAKKLILDAKKFGADAVKLQTYTPSTMTVNSRKKYFKINEGLWKGYNLWDLYKKAYTPYVWHKKLFEFGKKKKIKVFSTPFDETAVNFLENLNCPFYKVASFEMKDISLVKKIISTGKPIIISTGMANFKEIEFTYNKAKHFGAKKIALLYCVSNYPSKIDDFNLNNIKLMKKKFKCEIGFSDHSNDFRIASAAVLAGATIFEKHICLKNVKALDSEFSIHGSEILNYKNSLQKIDYLKNQKEFVKKILGVKKFFRNKTEDKSKKFRRSIFTVKRIKKGEIFTRRNIRKIRPGYGLSPSNFEEIIGKISKYNIKAFEPLAVKHVKLK